jgi:endoglucanase
MDPIRKKFPIQRGINISHWLSQNPDQSSSRDHIFTEQDVEFLAKKGYDHLRIPFDEENLWDTKGIKQPEAFELLHNAVGWCIKYNLKAILDLHIIRSHHFNNNKNVLWESKREQDHFVDMWMQLSEEFSKYPNDILAYELLNEAVADNPHDWNKLVNATLIALRKKEPTRMIVIGSNKWQSPDTFHELELPETDKNIIVSFHFYSPQIFTHYQAPWMKISAYKGDVKYPGQAVSKKELSNYDKDVIDEVEKHNGNYTKDSLLKQIQEPIKYAHEHGLQLYCGEFGCLPTVHRSDRLLWYKDVRSIFETNNISWANWDYKGAFAIFYLQSGEPDDKLISILLDPLVD